MAVRRLIIAHLPAGFFMIILYAGHNRFGSAIRWRPLVAR
jgi:hypothetical protein